MGLLKVAPPLPTGTAFVGHGPLETGGQDTHTQEAQLILQVVAWCTSKTCKSFLVFHSYQLYVDHIKVHVGKVKFKLAHEQSKNPLLATNNWLAGGSKLLFVQMIKTKEVGGAVCSKLIVGRRNGEATIGSSNTKYQNAKIPKYHQHPKML